MKELPTVLGMVDLLEEHIDQIRRLDLLTSASDRMRIFFWDGIRVNNW